MAKFVLTRKTNSFSNRQVNGRAKLFHSYLNEMKENDREKRERVCVCEKLII